MDQRPIFRDRTGGSYQDHVSALKGGGIIGIDFGATQLRAGIVTEHGVHHIERRRTPNQGTASDVWEALSDLMDAVIKRNGSGSPVAVCAGVPSVVDVQTGTVYDVQHVPACKVLPLGQLITEKYGVTALVNNDANAFALGEYYFGKGAGREPAARLSEEDADPLVNTSSVIKNATAGKAGLPPGDLDRARLSGTKAASAASLVGLTIGTGLGAGLILNGKLYSGPNCGAGEIGCLPYLDANLEHYVSGAFFKSGGLDGEIYYHQALKGDPEALDVFREFGQHLGQAVKIVLYTYDPDMIILGGSVSQAYAFFKEEMFKTMEDFDFPGILAKVQVYPSQLRHAAILGAASLYFDYVKR